ncbi:MAG: hypothetical protein ACTSYD_09635 [Candidatus Heimdallarchaeaceae archaeon]
MNEPIKQFLAREFAETKRIHQLRQLFDRYRNMHKALVNRYSNQFMCSEDLIVSALYCSDYIITNSELKEPLEDEIRINEIINAWKDHLQTLTSEQWYVATYLTAFIYRVASITRKRYYFLLDKGVTKDVAAAYIADLFITPLIEFCIAELPSLSLAWISILVETALVQSIFSKIQEKRAAELSNFEVENIGTYSHFIAYHFSSESEAKTNTAVPLPYVDDSQLIYYILWKTGMERQHNVFGTTTEKQKGQISKITKNLIDKISKRDIVHILKYLRASYKIETKEQERNIFFVHASSEDAEAWLILISAVDDVNVKFLETLLQQKLQDIPNFHTHKSKLPKIYVYEELKQEMAPKKEEQIQIAPKQKMSIIQRFLSLFRRKVVQKTLEIKKTKPKKSSYDVLLDIFAQELLVASVANIDLGINVYDDYREHMFEINGVFMSKKDQEPPTYFIAEKMINYPSDLLDPIIDAIHFGKDFLTLQNGYAPLYIYPDEALFMQKTNEDIIRLIECTHANEILVGTVADKKIDTHLLTKKKTPAYKRRSIQKKTRELQAALKVHSLEDAVKNIFSADIDPKNLQITSENEPLFFFS